MRALHAFWDAHHVNVVPPRSGFQILALVVQLLELGSHHSHCGFQLSYTDSVVSGCPFQVLYSFPPGSQFSILLSQLNSSARL